MMTKIVVTQPCLPIWSRTVVKDSVTSVGGPRRFPIHRIYCVGRNYREHAIEMGGDPDREPPFFFMKPPDAIVDASSRMPFGAGGGGSESSAVAGDEGSCLVPYPPMTSSLHHEGELVVAIGRGGLRIPVDEAVGHVFGYAVGCDLTRRDLQSEAKKKSRPWDAAKGFDYSAPCGPIMPREEADLPPSARIVLEVNGEVRQESTLDRMIWNVPETLSYLSQSFRLKPGDLIMTGTPAGVAAIESGDTVKILCGNLPPCAFTVGPAE